MTSLPMELRSSDGWSQLAIEVRCAWRDSELGTLWLAQLSIRGQFWGRRGARNGAEDLSLEEDFSVQLYQVVLRQEYMEELARRLEHWLATPHEFAMELSGVNGQSFEVTFSEREDVLCSIDRPAFTARYVFGKRFTGEWSQVVDQSCIRIFVEGLCRAQDVCNRAPE